MPNINDHSPDEFLAAFLADTRNGPLALYAGAALDAAGRHNEAMIVWTFGADVNPNLRTIHQHPDATGDLKQFSLRADQAIRQHFNSLHEKAVNDVANEFSGENLDRVRNAIWVQHATTPFGFKIKHQRPMTFYLPDLPARPVTSIDMLPWASAVEKRYAEILSEYQTAIARDVVQYPYVPGDVENQYWSKLRGKMDWAALYLFFNKTRTEQAEYFPKTLDTLHDVPLVTKDGAAMEMFFSRLRPGAHIPAHTGLTNCRLTVHLPLIVPENCQIRVGDELHQWEEGKIIAFDDSYEHEVWNRSDTERVVFIFETYHPDLTKAEIAAIKKSWTAIDSWIDGRASTIGLPTEEEFRAQNNRENFDPADSH